MAIIDSTASDSTYHSRHSKRTLQRAKRIGRCIDVPGSLLDVGCNNGITSAYMLDSGKATHVTGIELSADTVEARLKQNANFTLLEGNVVDLELPQRYDHIIYGAVHHHILNLFGLSAAIDTLQKLVSHCNKQLFFETGQIGEGGRWGWQSQMRRHFRTDEEHFFYLLRSIEHRIEGFEEIGSFWIHGIRRHYLRIIVRNDGANEQESPDDWQTDLDGPYVRSRGSRGQILQKSDDAGELDSPTQFWIGAVDGKKQFIKKHVHLPVAAAAEWSLGEQLDEDWAVVPVKRYTADHAIVFPYLEDAAPIQSFRAAPSAERRLLASQVTEIFERVGEIEVSVPKGVLLSSRSNAGLIDVVDLNANNFLVVRENQQSVVRVVDFELQSLSYAPRNRLHVAAILWTLGQRRLTAVALFLRGVAGVTLNLATYQFVPFVRRVSAKQPSLFSVLTADFRTAAGRLLGRMLRVVGLR